MVHLLQNETRERKWSEKKATVSNTVYYASHRMFLFFAYKVSLLFIFFILQYFLKVVEFLFRWFSRAAIKVR